MCTYKEYWRFSCNVLATHPTRPYGSHKEGFNARVGYGTDCEVTVQDTRVDDSVFSPLLDGIAVPVRQIFEQLRGAGATTVDATVMYLDDEFRIVRTIDDQVFMYTRIV